jgi:hypothetical protein
MRFIKPVRSVIQTWVRSLYHPERTKQRSFTYPGKPPGVFSVMLKLLAFSVVLHRNVLLADQFVSEL